MSDFSYGYKKIEFRLTLETVEALVYSETMPPMPIPGIGEDIFVGGNALGWWRAKSISWMVPQIDAQTPSMWVTIYVDWSPINPRPAPIYDPELGWVKKGE